MQYSQNLHTLGSLLAYLVFFSLMHIWPIDILSQISPVWNERVNFKMALSNQLVEFSEIPRAPSFIKRGLTQPTAD